MKPLFIIAPRSTLALIVIVMLHCAVAVLLLVAYGCSATGTKHAYAYALHVWSQPNSLHSHVTGQVASISHTPGAVTHFRERHTTTATPPPTAGQRAGLIVGTGLGIGTLALIAAAFLCPGALAALALRTASRWRAAFAQTVAGIDAAKEDDNPSTLTQHLRATQDDRTRRLVHKVRAS